MQNAGLVRGAESSRDAETDTCDFRRRHRFAHRVETGSAQPLHGDEATTVVFAVIVERNDVRMRDLIERLENARFAFEAIGTGHAATENFHRDERPVCFVFGEKDVAHAAGADGKNQSVGGDSVGARRGR